MLRQPQSGAHLSKRKKTIQVYLRCHFFMKTFFKTWEVTGQCAVGRDVFRKRTKRMCALSERRLCAKRDIMFLWKETLRSSHMFRLLHEAYTLLRYEKLDTFSLVWMLRR